MPDRPRLAHNPIMTLFKQLREENRFKFYLISRPFLNSLFAKGKGGLLPHLTLSFDLNNIMFLTGWYGSDTCLALLNLRLATKLLQLAYIEALELNFDYEGLDRRLLNVVVEVSRALKKKHELQYLNLFANKNSINMVLDALPKGKIRTLEVDSLNAPIPKCVLEEMEHLKICEMNDKLDYLQILRVPTRCIEFTGTDVDLFNLHQQGPFHPNPKLQTIQIPVSLELGPLNFLPESWIDVALHRYKDIFYDLKSINNQIKIKIGNNAPQKMSYQYHTVDGGVQMHRRLLRNIEAFIDLAYECGIQLEMDKYFCTILNFPIEDDTDDDLFYMQDTILANQLKLECNDYQVFGIFEHNGVKFQLVYDFFYILG